MTGDEATLRSVGAEYGLIFSQQSPAEADHHPEEVSESDSSLDHENYFVQHTSPVFLIDREGVLRMVALYGSRPEVLASSLRQLLQESAGEA
jgi:cytochrome oxidase Cu insertion factor (SCO1/SenC/PrrC family)